MKNFKIGDLVYTIIDEKKIFGIVLEVNVWSDIDADVYVHWNDNKTFWCNADAVNIFSKNKNNN